MSSRRSQRASLLWLLGSAALGGCAENDGPDYPWYSEYSQYTEVRTQSEGTVCGTSLDLLDERIERVAALLEVSLEPRISISVTWDPSQLGCRSSASGCYGHEDRAIRTKWESVHHEVVHALVRRAGPSDDFWFGELSFWNEGLADVMKGPRITRRVESPSVRSAMDGDVLDGSEYATAAHFVRWLIEEHGEAWIPEIVRGAAFEDVFGESVDAAIARYEQTAPYSYDGWFACHGEQVAPVDGVFSVETDAECGPPNVVNDHGGSGRSHYYLLDVEEAGMYEVRLTSPEGSAPAEMIYCLPEVVEDKPATNLVGDIIINTSAIPESLNRGGRDQIGGYRLEPGRHMLAIPWNNRRVSFSMRRTGP